VSRCRRERTGAGTPKGLARGEREHKQFKKGKGVGKGIGAEERERNRK